MNSDVLGALAHFVGPRELLRLACTCRAGKTWVTHAAVVAAVLFRGGKSARKTLALLRPLLAAAAVFVPSPLRVLRLCVALRCENAACREKVLHIRPDFGLHLCFACLKALTADVSHKRKRDLLLFPKHIVLHPRAAIGCRQQAIHYILINTFVDASGEKCGPLLTAESLTHPRRIAENRVYAAQHPKKLTPEIMTPFFTEAFDEWLESSEDWKNASAESPARNTILKYFDKLEASAKEHEEVTLKRKSDAKDAKMDAKRVKLQTLTQSVKDLAVLRVPEWIIDIALESPFYCLLTSDFRKAPSKLRKKDSSDLSDTLVDFYGSIPDSFRDFNLVAPDNENPEFWKLISAIAKRIGHRRLLTHTANPSSFIMFSMFKANLFREAIALKCLSLLGEAFVGAALQNDVNDSWDTIRLSGNQTVTRDKLKSLSDINGVDKEFVAAVVETLDGFSSRDLVSERLGWPNMWSEEGTIVGCLWLHCGGYLAASQFKSACCDLVQNFGSTKDWECDWLALRELTQWERLWRCPGSKVPDLQLDVNKLANHLQAGHSESIAALKLVQEKLRELAGFVSRFLKGDDLGKFVENVCGFYPHLKHLDTRKNEDVDDGDDDANGNGDVIDLTLGDEVELSPNQEHERVPKQISEAVECWKNRKFNPRSAAEIRLVYRGQFPEATVLNMKRELPKMFVAAALEENQEIIQELKHFCSISQVKILLELLWRSDGAKAFEKLESAVPNCGISEPVNSCSSVAMRKGKGRAHHGFNEDVTEAMNSLDAVFVGSRGKLEPLLRQMMMYCNYLVTATNAVDASSVSVDQVIRDFQSASCDMNDIIMGNFREVGDCIMGQY
ncbi:hypothetical protein BDR26DRAFT_914464 [Obelidium mucronatum]|nr:hypothetical protein BDR26DRAFT_914464 [Obelidium mucronatum]